MNQTFSEIIHVEYWCICKISRHPVQRKEQENFCQYLALKINSTKANSVITYIKMEHLNNVKIVTYCSFLTPYLQHIKIEMDSSETEL